VNIRIIVDLLTFWFNVCKRYFVLFCHIFNILWFRPTVVQYSSFV